MQLREDSSLVSEEIWTSASCSDRGDEVTRWFSQTRICKSESLGPGLESLGVGVACSDQTSGSMESSLFWEERAGLERLLTVTRGLDLPRSPPHLYGDLYKEANVSWFHGSGPWPVEGEAAFAPIHSPAFYFRRVLD